MVTALAGVVSEEADYRVASEFAYRALRFADLSDDPSVACELLVGGRNGLFQIKPPGELLEISKKVKVSSSSGALDHFRDEAFAAMVCDLLRLGRFDEVQREVEEQRQRVEENRRPWSGYLLESVESLIALWEGRFEDVERHLGRIGGFLEGTQKTLWGAKATVEQVLLAQTAWLIRERGLTGLLMENQEAVATATRQAGNTPVWQVALSLLALETGDYEQAKAIVFAVVEASRNLVAFPPHGWAVPTLCLLAEVCASLHEAGTDALGAAGNFELSTLTHNIKQQLLPHLSEMALAGWPAVMIGPVARAAALAEVALGSYDRAVALFAAAQRRAWLSRPLRSRLHLEMSGALLSRDALDDRVKARAHLQKAIEEAERLGMSTVEGKARAMLRQVE